MIRLSYANRSGELEILSPLCISEIAVGAVQWSHGLHAYLTSDGGRRSAFLKTVINCYLHQRNSSKFQSRQRRFFCCQHNTSSGRSVKMKHAAVGDLPWSLGGQNAFVRCWLIETALCKMLDVRSFCLQLPFVVLMRAVRASLKW